MGKVLIDMFVYNNKRLSMKVGDQKALLIAFCMLPRRHPTQFLSEIDFLNQHSTV